MVVDHMTRLRPTELYVTDRHGRERPELQQVSEALALAVADLRTAWERLEFRGLYRLMSPCLEVRVRGPETVELVLSWYVPDAEAKTHPGPMTLLHLGRTVSILYRDGLWGAVRQMLQDIWTHELREGVRFKDVPDGEGPFGDPAYKHGQRATVFPPNYLEQLKAGGG
jgi:hypothetical protein